MLIPFSFLPRSRINGIIHVGAHECEELETYVEDRVRKVLWIEANPDKYTQVQEKISAVPGMDSACFAAGNVDGETKRLSIANNGQSSSLLRLGTHSYHHPSVQFIAEKEVTVRRIDEYLEEKNIAGKNFNMICLDIQGYELEALKGAKILLANIDYVYTEVNTEEVYKDCAKLTEMDGFLSHYGFSRTWLSMTKNGWGDAFYSRGNRYLNKGSFVLRAIAAKVKSKALRAIRKK